VVERIAIGKSKMRLTAVCRDMRKAVGTMPWNWHADLPCRLAELCKERENAYQEKSLQILAAGTIVNTMGWVDGQGKEVQAHICRAFEADVIIAIGDDRLHSAMQAAFQVLGLWPN
jgi:hypothetical protein